MTAVLDSGVIVSGIFWRNESYRCLVALARRDFFLAASDAIFAEYAKAVGEVKKTVTVECQPHAWLDFLKQRAVNTEPAPLGSRVCRDPKDDMFIECALAGNASHIVTRDKDLLVLKKPFGIEIVTPRKFLSLLAEEKE